MTDKLSKNGLTKIHISELPEDCFVNESAKLINGNVWFRECDIGALRNIKILFHGHNDPLLFEAIVLVFYSIPDIYISISASGQNIYFGKGCKGSWVFRLFGENASAHIDEQTTCNGAEVFINDNGQLLVGKDCMFAGGISLHVGDNHAVFDMESAVVLNYRKNPYIDIKNHVWVGQRATIIGDCNIGVGAVIASNSVCLIDVLDCSLLAGNPGKIKKNNISWTRSYEGNDSLEIMHGLKKEIARNASENIFLPKEIDKELELPLMKNELMDSLATELVSAAYKGILLREPDAIGLAIYSATLKKSHKLSDILSELSSSEEHWKLSIGRHANDLIQTLYRSMLSRDADALELEVNAQAISETNDLTVVLTEIVNSQEFKENQGINILRVTRKENHGFTEHNLSEQKKVAEIDESKATLD